VTFGISGTFNSYTNDFQQEAWNLPTIKLNSNIDFNITQSGLPVRLFYVGERKDYQMNSDIIYIVASENPTILKSYFDVNAHLGYKYNSQLTGFRANNITNNGYQKMVKLSGSKFSNRGSANYNLIFKFDFKSKRRHKNGFLIWEAIFRIF
jgi:hypothetical protein